MELLYEVKIIFKEMADRIVKPVLKALNGRAN